SINDRNPAVPPSDSSPPCTTLSMGTRLPTRRWRARLDRTCESDHPGRYSLPGHPQVLIIALDHVFSAIDGTPSVLPLRRKLASVFLPSSGETSSFPVRPATQAG